MADEFKKLLAKVSLDTSSFPADVKRLKAVLDDLYQQEKKKVAEQRQALNDHSAALKKNAEQMKSASDQQFTASKKQIQVLQQSKQAYTDITQASVRLKAQTDLEAISLGTVLKKRQDIVAQCEIEMERVTRLRTPLMEQTRLLSQITAERAKQLALIDKQRSATVTASLTSQRSVQQLGRTQELAYAENRRRDETQRRQQQRSIVPVYEQESTRLRSQLLTGELTKRKEIEAAERRVLTIIDSQIKAISQKVALDRTDIETLNRLQNARQRTVQMTGGSGGRGGEEGFFGKLQRNLVGGLGFSEISGGVFTGVLAAEVVADTIKEITKSTVELVAESGALQHLQETYQRLGSIRGTDTTRFLEQMRDATHDLVGDTQLLKLTNAVWQSDLKISNGQIVQLTHNVVALARAQGHSPDEAMSALQSAFIGRGRNAGGAAFMQIGRVTGIPTAELMLQKFGQVLPQVVDREEALNKVLDVTNRKMLEVGDPALTLTDRIQILGKEWERTKEAFAISLVKSEGFREFTGFLDDVIHKLREGEETGKSFGEKLGQAFTLVKPLVELVRDAIADLFGILKAASPLTGIFSDLGPSNEVVQRTTTFIGMISTLAEAMVLIRGTIDEISLRLEYTIKELGGGSFTKPVAEYVQDINRLKSKGALTQLAGGTNAAVNLIGSEILGDKGTNTAGAHQEFLDKLKASSDQEQAELKQLEQFRTGTGPKAGEQGNAAGVLSPEVSDPAYAVRLAKLNAEVKEAVSKAFLDKTKENLQAEKDANEQAYHSMQETFAEYINEKKRLRREDLAATLLEAKQNHDAKQDEISFERDLATIDLKRQLTQAKAQKPDTDEAKQAQAQQIKELEDEIKLTGAAYNKHAQINDAQYRAQVSSANRAAAQEQQQLDDQKQKDIEAAARTHAQALLKINQDGLEDWKQRLEENFKEGLVSADDYLAQRKSQITAERNYTLAELDDVKAHTEETLESDAKDQEARAAAEQKLIKDNLAIDLNANDTRLKSIENYYDKLNKLADTQVKISKTPFGARITGVSETTAIQAAMAENADYINQLQKQLSIQQYGSELWIQTADKIGDATERQQQFNEQLIQARDLLTPISGLFNQIAGILSIRGRGGLFQVSEGLQAGARSMQSAAEFSKTMQSAVPGKSPIAGLAQEARDAFKGVKGGSDSATTTVYGFSGALKRATEVVAGFIHAFGGGGFTNTSGAGLPHFAAGGPVQETGPIFAHQNEFVLTTAMQSQLKVVVQTLTTTIDTLNHTFTTMAQNVGLVSTAMSRLATGTVPGAPAPAIQSTLLGGAIGALPLTAEAGTTTTTGALQGGEAPAQSGLSKFLQTIGGTGQGGGVGAVSAFISGLTSAVGAIGGFIQATVGAKTATSGAVGGALSGGSIGSEFGGPIGAIVGAIGGGIFGALMGAKNASILAKITSLQEQLTTVIGELNQGAVGLNEAIGQASAIENQIADLSGTTSGATQKAQQTAASQAQAQIQTLQEQQNSVLQNLQTSLDNLVIPTGYQQFVGSLEQIFTQYNQFAGAATNVTQLAQAQEYLTNALQQYATTQATAVQSAEITAIQNGLNLNNLYIQRQQLMENFAQQEQSIMSGGVAVREETASASKAGQLQQLQVQYNQQMDQLNLQITVAQYQYETQQQIYGLATTRVGLETQLVQLQESQTDTQNASNAALLNIVNTIRNTPASQLSTTPQLMAALGLPYSGPTAAQVGPQIGTLGAAPSANTPEQFLQTLMSSSLGQQMAQQAGVASNATTLTPAQMQQVLTAIQVYSDTNLSAPLISLYGSLESLLTGAPASTFNPNYPVSQVYPLSSATVPWETGTAPVGASGSNPTTPLGPAGPSPLGPSARIAASASITSGTTSSPIYYLADPTSGAVTPVYTAPTVMGNIGSLSTAPSILGGSTAAQSAANLSAAPTILGGGSSTSGYPAGLTLYGTDSSGNPVYVDQDGMLYTASGQNIGNIAASSSFTVTGQGQAGYYTTPGFSTPSNTMPSVSSTTGLGSQSGATTTLQDLLQYPSLINQASAPISVPGSAPTAQPVLPVGSGPTDAPGGPVILTGSSNPFAYGPNVGSPLGNLLGSGLNSSPGAVSPQPLAPPITMPVPAGYTASPIPAGSSLGTVTPALGTGTPASTNPVVFSVLQAMGLVPNSGSGQQVIPSYDTGVTSVPNTGLAMLHAGESVIPVGASATSQAQATLGSAQVSTEQQTSSLASSRIGLEMKLLSMKQAQNQNDMALIQAYQTLFGAIGSGNFNGIGNALNKLTGARGGAAGAPTVEDQMYDLYRERGRYGEGGVAGNYP